MNKPPRKNAPGQGRPPIMKDGKRINVYLDAASLAKALKIGAGNLSAGVRIAIQKFTGDKK